MEGDATVLLTRLTEFHSALDRHQRRAAEHFERMEREIGLLAPLYQGEAAEQFRQRWRHSQETFRTYRDGMRDLERMLAERVEALSEAERGQL